MGVKLELLLLVLIAVMFMLGYTVKLSDEVSGKPIAQKEMQFTDATLTEVNTQKLLSTLSGTYGVRTGGVLTVDNLIYHTDSIERLWADRGRYVGETAYLDGRVRVKQKEGFNYSAEHAVYNKKTGVLDITSKFTAVLAKNIVHGNTAHYDTRKKILFAKEINAVLYTAQTRE